MIETYPDGDAAAQAASGAIAAALRHDLEVRGRACLVATGGRSPGPVFDRLREADLDWGRIDVTLSDERCVPADDPASNARAVRERLLQGRATTARFLSLWPSPTADQIASLQPFSAVMLGMGEDGHVASLIPGDPGLPDALTTLEPLRPVPAGLGSPPVARVTLTLSALLNARAIFILVAGEAKRSVIQRAAAGEDLPVGRLLSQSRIPVRIFWQPEHGG